MKLLNAPYGYECADWVSIRLSYIEGASLDKYMVVVALGGFGCPLNKVKKILSCLEHSSYECLVQGSWFRDQEEVCLQEFREAGVLVEIVSKSPR